MTFRRRFKLSEHQRNDMWRRWKAGQSLHEIGRAFSKDMCRFNLCWRSMAGSLQRRGIAQR